MRVIAAIALCAIALSATIAAAGVIRPLVHRPAPALSGALLLEDNVSILLLEDNSSSLCLEGGC